MSAAAQARDGRGALSSAPGGLGAATATGAMVGATRGQGVFGLPGAMSSMMGSAFASGGFDS